MFVFVCRSKAAGIVPKRIVIVLARPRKGLDSIVEEEGLSVPYGVKLRRVPKPFAILRQVIFAEYKVDMELT